MTPVAIVEPFDGKPIGMVFSRTPLSPLIARKSVPRTLFAALAFMLGTVFGLAAPHGDLHERIAAVTEKIKANPNDAALYLERGDLHRRHGDWATAHADFDTAAEKNPGDFAVLYYRAQAWYDEGKLDLALDAVQKFTAREKLHADAWILEARTLSRLERWTECAAAYATGMSLKKVVAPDDCIGRAHALTKSTPPDYAAAVKVLESGIEKLGRPITLRLKLIDVLADAKRTDDALRWMQEIIDASPRKEAWILKKADILAAAGRKDDAVAEYRAVLQAVAGLSERLKSLITTKEIVSRAEAALKELGAQSK